MPDDERASVPRRSRTVQVALARHASDLALVAAGFGCYGLGLLVAWVAPSPVVVAAGAAVFGAWLGLTMPAVDAGVSDLVSREFRAGALSLRNSATFLGRATGPVVFAGLAAVTGYGALLLAGGVAALGAAVLVGLSTRRPEPSAADVA